MRSATRWGGSRARRLIASRATRVRLRTDRFPVRRVWRRGPVWLPLHRSRPRARAGSSSSRSPMAAARARRARTPPAGAVKRVKDAVGGDVKDVVGKKIDQAGGATGMAKEAGKGMLPGFGGDDDGGDSSKEPGAQIGNTRRMPVQQAIDVAVPLETAYNQWTQFEEWPNFMHRIDRASQEDETHVSFKAKIWGISREFTAEILEQRPDERIKWRVTEGVSHTGVVTFHRPSDRLTRVEVDIDIQPGSLLEKAGRGARHAKRAIRADLSRFKAYIELEDDETGAWRGEIDDGDVKSTRARSSSSRRSQGSNGRSGSAAARSGSSSRAASSKSSSGGRSSSGRSSGASSSGRSSGGSSSGRSSGGSSS